MNHFYYLTLVLAFSWQYSAQTIVTYLKPKQVQELAQLAQKREIIAVIENEKSTSEAMLVQALEKYWKVSKVKYMSELEFTNKLTNNKLSNDQLYLFRYNTNYFSSVPSLSKEKGIVYFLSNSPKELLSSRDRPKVPYLVFSYSSFDYVNRMVINIPIQYINLMVKNFNHELELAMNSNYEQLKKSITKKKDISYFDNIETIKTKNVLLVKEQVKKQATSRKKSKKKRITYVTKDFTKSNANTFVVFPEDIEHALKKNDNQVLLYNNDVLYDAESGKAVAIRAHKSTFAFWFAYIFFSLIFCALFFVGAYYVSTIE
ncbi:MAG: hypothetical protein AB7O73_00200 [Bacteroidia bacterium]